MIEVLDGAGNKFEPFPHTQVWLMVEKDGVYYSLAFRAETYQECAEMFEDTLFASGTRKVMVVAAHMREFRNKHLVRPARYAKGIGRLCDIQTLLPPREKSCR